MGVKNPRLIFREVSVLLRSIPSWVTALFVASLIAMNLLANKSIAGLPDWLALDAGFLFSWVGFAMMDMTVKRFGARASNYLCVFALFANLVVICLFFGASLVPGFWSSAFTESGDVDMALNDAVNQIFAGNWFIVFGSSMAFLTSGIFNNCVNALIGRVFKKDGFGTFAVRSYVSTFLGQFVDNLVFALIVSLHLFGWTLLQSVTCALTGAIAELLMEIIFSPLNYKVAKSWEKHNIGKEYFDLIGAEK